MYEEPLILLIAFISSFGFFHSPHNAKAELARRLEKASTVISQIKDKGPNTIAPPELRRADCVAVIPGHRSETNPKVASSHGFISCRNGDNWTAPGGIESDTPESRGQAANGIMDLVMLFVDPGQGQSLFSAPLAVR